MTFVIINNTICLHRYQLQLIWFALLITKDSLLFLIFYSLWIEIYSMIKVYM